jgi:hypothetical protein
MLLAAGLTEAEVEVKIEAKVETLLAPANDYSITLSVFYTTYYQWVMRITFCAARVIVLKIYWIR